MATSTPVLDLNTVDPHVSINGDLYPLRVREDLSILTNAAHAKKFARIEALRVNGKRTVKEEGELASLLEQVCGVVLTAPANVLEKLSQYQRLSVVTAFFQQVAKANQSNRERRATGDTATSTSKKSPRA